MGTGGLSPSAGFGYAYEWLGQRQRKATEQGKKTKKLKKKIRKMTKRKKKEKSRRPNKTIRSPE